MKGGYNELSSLDSKYEDGGLDIYRHADQQQKRGRYTLVARGVHQPKPFHRVGKGFSSQHHLEDYLKLIGDEVTKTRASAAALAAAFGGLVIIALQLHGRIFGG